MNFNLKQWRDESAQEEAEEEAEDQNQPPKPNSYDHHPCALPLFSSEPNTNMSEPYSKSHYHPNTPSADKFSSMGSYFSCSQWQELELQALIFRHMTAGASVPLELLHLVKKSLINTPSSPYYTYYQPPLLQSGYWGRSGMDPEPGRCRRTDGKKWRCSRDVVAGQKYCERHMHRGRNRSRKPVETPTSVPYGGETPKTHYSVAKQAPAAGTNSFTLTTTTPRSSDLLHLNQRRACDSIIETKKGGPFEPQDDGQSSGRTLRHFFDDWPKPIQESGSAASDTNLSIWMPGNPPSDFGLKLGTGGVGDRPSSDLANNSNNSNSNNSNKAHSSWGMAWENNNNPGAPMGGPLAEALRSSASNSPSPTSVLYRLARGSVSETSFVTL